MSGPRSSATTKFADGMRRPSRPRPPHRGMILVVVLVVVSLLTLAALTFSQMMLAEREATELTGRRLEARALAQSGVDYIRMMLMQDETALMELGGVFNNPYEFSGHLVVDDADARDRGRFAVISPAMENGYSSGVRYGMEDESARLNINVVAQYETQTAGTGREILMKLPGMTEDIADAILDWIDADDETREFGAEQDYYSALVPGYAPKNGPLDSIDELLLVREVTPWLLYGVDANRNGNADSMEPDSQSLMDVDNTDGSLNSGWASYLTVHSMESTQSDEGEAKIDLNQDDLEALYDELSAALSADWAAFIVGFRQNGASTVTNGRRPPYPARNEINFGTSANPPASSGKEVSSVLDLVGASVQLNVQPRVEGNQNGKLGLAPILEENSAELESELIKLLDAVTVSSEETLSGRININQAPRAVLLTIPGMTEEAADQIVSTRIENPLEADQGQGYTVWPLIQGVVDLETMKSLERYICTGGSVFRAQIVGYYDGGGPYARLEVIFDATQSPPAVLSWNDIGHLGQGYPIEMLGLESGQATDMP
ncbi:MAG: hypothetical protein ACYC6Y_27740 [Thermoguttaceae bacterium]